MVGVGLGMYEKRWLYWERKFENSKVEKRVIGNARLGEGSIADQIESKTSGARRLVGLYPPPPHPIPSHHQ